MKYILIIIVILSLHSCSLEKRRYTRGFHVHNGRFTKVNIKEKNQDNTEFNPTNDKNDFITLQENKSIGYDSILLAQKDFSQKRYTGQGIASINKNNPIEALQNSRPDIDSIFSIDSTNYLSQLNPLVAKKIKRNRAFKKILVFLTFLTNVPGTPVTVPLLIINAKKYRDLIDNHFTIEQKKSEVNERKLKLIKTGNSLFWWVLLGSAPFAALMGLALMGLVSLFSSLSLAIIFFKIFAGTMTGIGFYSGIAAFFLYKNASRLIDGNESLEKKRKINRLKILRIICLVLVIVGTICIILL